MSSIIHIMGRPTKDPVMQQAQNGGSEYVLLDVAVTQRNQKGENETIFYNCYFNKFQGQRLLNAKVKSGTCLWIYGPLELQSFIYQKGQKQGQAGINAKISVSDWQFVIANRTENNPAAPNANPPAGNYNAGGMPASNPGMAPPNKPHPDDLSRCENYEDFLEKLNSCIRKLFLALRKDGRLAILVGDIRSKGNFYSIQHDIMRMGSFESFIVKGQSSIIR